MFPSCFQRDPQVRILWLDARIFPKGGNIFVIGKISPSGVEQAAVVVK
jgi:hypothetical protein